MDLGGQKRQSDLAASTTLQEAAAWDSRLRAPDCTDDDRARFAAWRDADPTHTLAFERLQIITATLRHDRGRADVRALRDEALRAVFARRRRRFSWAAAAAFVLALPAVLWVAQGSDWLRQPIDTVVALIAGSQSYATGIGQRSTFALEDGSSVELNAQSKIRVSFTQFQRRVELLHGQAMFNVAKNPERPFIVHAGDREIIAVGTQFDVRLDTRSVQVTLIEGRVRVTSPAPAIESQTPGSNASSRSNEVLLTPGKQLIARLDQVLSTGHPDSTDSDSRKISSPGVGTSDPELTDSIRDIDTARVTGWHDGRVFFEDQSLADAVAEMNKYSTTQIEISDPTLATLHVNGMFIAGRQQAFATALENYFPIIAERHGDKGIVLTTRR